MNLKRTAEASRSTSIECRRALRSTLGIALVLTLSACPGTDEPPRAEPCVWQLGTISSDRAEPGFEGGPVLRGIRFGIVAANREEKFACRLELVERSAPPAGRQLETAAHEMGAADRLVAVIGPYSSSAVDGASAAFAESGVPLFVPSAARADLNIADRTRFFRLIAHDDVEGEAAGRFLTEVAGARRVVLVSEQSDYAQAVAEALSRSLGSIVVDADELEDPAELEEVVGAAKKAAPDAIFFSGTGATLAQLISSAEGAGLDVLFTAPSTGKDPGLLGLSEARGALIFCSCADPAASSDSEMRGWATDFQREMGEAPGPFSLEAYEGVQMVAAALAGSGFTRDSPPAEIREGIAAWAHANAYPGLSKTYAFDSQGELEEAPVFVYQVSSSGWREVGKVDDLI
ncbi:MAG: branched-chain amino acid ABC transporter substrate-binding protein [Actinomycetota bacterium]